MSAGSLRRISIRGIDFDLVADTDVDAKMNVNQERVATTGKSMKKTVFQIAETPGFKIVYTKANVTLLEGMISDSQESEIFYTDVDNEDFHCTGTFRIDSKSTMNGEINITVLPEIGWV